MVYSAAVRSALAIASNAAMISWWPRRARGFGLSIHYHNRNRVAKDTEADLEATYWESLDQMLAHVDILSVNCPHTPATYHLLSGRRLKLMQPSAYVVNTSRGEIVDEEVLVQMLRDGELSGAGLDVYEHEPEVNPALLACDNVVLLPHISSATLEGRIEMGEKVLINIRTFFDDHRVNQTKIQTSSSRVADPSQNPTSTTGTPRSTRWPPGKYSVSSKVLLWLAPPCRQSQPRQIR